MRIDFELEDLNISTVENWRQRLSDRAGTIEAAIRQAQAEFEASIAPMRQEHERVIAMHGHVCQMLSLIGGPSANQDGTVSNHRSANSSKDLPDIAYRVLKDAGTEMYYRDLAARIISEGYNIRGSDPATYLLAYIGKDSRFVKVKRGIYALAEWKPKRITKRGAKRPRTRSAKPTQSHD